MLVRGRGFHRGYNRSPLDKETLEGDEFRALMKKYHLPVSRNPDELEQSQKK